MKLKTVVAVVTLVAMPLCAQAQGAKTKVTNADAQRLLKVIGSDKAKTQAYCDMTKLGEQIAQAEQSKDDKKAEELAQQADSLAEKIGPEYVAFMDGLQDVDEKSKEGEAIGKTLDALDALCGK